MNSTMFFLAFLKNPKEIGSIIPSSESLAKKITANIDFERADCIVELGSGTGSITGELVRKSKCRILCLDTNKWFCDLLMNKFGDEISVFNSDASSLSRLGIKADYIVSGIPFRNLSPEKIQLILNEIKKCLKKDGRFILFQYTNFIENVLEEKFEIVKKEFVIFNFPPSIVYCCQ